jgi:hypothetical protein
MYTNILIALVIPINFTQNCENTFENVFILLNFVANSDAFFVILENYFFNRVLLIKF